ncbi:hypothetical protein FRC11_007531 [Ceratobasidium sp. 423]|nr:hypothetical protein FRC11_007531 [Ceratobasidium sp. 423]
MSIKTSLTHHPPSTQLTTSSLPPLSPPPNTTADSSNLESQLQALMDVDDPPVDVETVSTETSLKESAPILTTQSTAKVDCSLQISTEPDDMSLEIVPLNQPCLEQQPHLGSTSQSSQPQKPTPSQLSDSGNPSKGESSVHPDTESPSASKQSKGQSLDSAFALKIWEGKGKPLALPFGKGASIGRGIAHGSMLPPTAPRSTGSSNTVVGGDTSAKNLSTTLKKACVAQASSQGKTKESQSGK